MNRTDERRGGRAFTQYAEMGRRFLLVIALAFWLGGFTFYAGVVIHTGHRVFGSARDTGFLTQQVTGWLNLSGAVVLTILWWNAVASRKVRGRWLQGGLWLTWAMMAGVQVALYALHPMLDRLLDVETHAISERALFRRLHLVYINLSTIQWAAGVLHTLLALLAWRAIDLAKDSLPASFDDTNSSRQRPNPNPVQAAP